jgi:hypothetical protein
MLRNILILFCFIIAGQATALAQLVSKERGKVGGRSYSYHVMRPSGPAKGIVLLMPSRGESPKELFWHTRIPAHLAKLGFITIVPKVDYALILEERTKDILEHLAMTEVTRGGLQDNNIIIGGFSSGGAIAAHYAEYRLLKRGNDSLKGVFLIDPPLDLARFYNAWTGLISTQCPRAIISESRFIKSYLEKITGGPPQEKKDAYTKLSAFTRDEPSGGNANVLQHVPVRLYTEPDLKAMQDKYCADLSYRNLNSSDLDALHECLRRLGNPDVEYIRTTGRGLHSWNIAEPEDLAQWAARILSRE